MADREIRYCVTDDGVSIAYSVEGDERHPPLVWIPGWVSHVELDGQTRDTLGVTAILGPVRFITFDKRGTGLSGRGIADFSSMRTCGISQPSSTTWGWARSRSPGTRRAGPWRWALPPITPSGSRT